MICGRAIVAQTCTFDMGGIVCDTRGALVTIGRFFQCDSLFRGMAVGVKTALVYISPCPDLYRIVRFPFFFLRSIRASSKLASKP